MSELPENWVTAKLGALGVWSGGGTPSKSNPTFWEGGTIPWVSPKDMKFVSIDDSQDHITESAVKGSATKILPKGSLLVVTRSGILQHSLPVATNSRDVTLNQDLKALTPKDGFDVKYLYFAIRRFERDILHVCCKAGTTVQSIEFPRLKDFEIPIAPLSEQRRIVARIEELFSHLDAGVAALRQAKAQLQRYRQSVLAAAVTGQLTQAWREQHPGTEPAEELLKRILKQRREQWSGRGRYEEPSPHAADGLRSLPDSWKWCSVLEASETVVDCPHSTAKFTERGEACIDTTCIRPGRVIHEKLRFVSRETYNSRIARLDPQPSDIIFAREGTVGTAVAIPSGLKPCLGQRVMLMRPSSAVLPAFFECALNSLTIRAQYLPKILGSTSPHLNVGDVKLLAIPLPPLAEQHQIVAEVEARTTAIDHLEAELDRQITRANRLRQSTLASAFSGAL